MSNLIDVTGWSANDVDTFTKMMSRREGRVGYGYTDSLGYLTIGVGHLIDRRKGGSLPDCIIDALFQYDSVSVTQVADAHVSWWRDEVVVRQFVMSDLLFNLGWNEAASGGLDDFKATLAAWQDKDYKTAAARLLQSQYAKQLPGRSQENAFMLENGTFPVKGS